MAKTFRFQFSLTGQKTTEHLQTIPPKYRSLYIEIVLDAWFNSGEGKSSGKLYSTDFTFIPKEKSKTTRFRLSIANPNTIINLRSIPVRHRSLVTEMALNAWMDTKTGMKLFEMFTGKTMKQYVDSYKPQPERIDPKGDNFKVTRMKNKNILDTEQLMRNALAFD